MKSMPPSARDFRLSLVTSALSATNTASLKPPGAQEVSRVRHSFRIPDAVGITSPSLPEDPDVVQRTAVIQKGGNKGFCQNSW